MCSLNLSLCINRAGQIITLAFVIWCFLFLESVKAQQFAQPVVNPFGFVSATSTTNGFTANVALEDLDGDGDLDALVGNTDVIGGLYVGQFDYYENVGSVFSPQFAAPQVDPFGLTPFDGPRPTIGDLDGDGDLDIMMGFGMDNLYYLENTGSSTNPQFAAPVANPFSINLGSLVDLWTPNFVDLDNDGDLDVLATSFLGSIRYFENIGTASSPQFGPYQSDPFGILGFQNVDTMYPDFADLDGDGDLDLLLGGNFLLPDKFQYFENIGTATNPQFSGVVGNPFGLINNGMNTMYPALADLDYDGDIDLLAGAEKGDFQYFENTSVTLSAKEVEAIAAIEIYPNPTNGFLFVDAENAINKLSIFNNLGQLVLSIKPKENHVDLSNVESGIYRIKIEDDKGHTTIQQVIKH